MNTKPMYNAFYFAIQWQCAFTMYKMILYYVSVGEQHIPIEGKGRRF